MSLLLFLSNDASVPLHRRVIAALMEAINSARLVPGALLPSSRELAVSLGVSRATVSKAYEELCRTGFLVTRVGGKTRVADVLPNQADPVEKAAAGLVGRRISSAPQEGMDKYVSSYALRLSRAGIVSSWGHLAAATPKRLLPIPQWKQILTKYCTELDAKKLVSDPFGDISFRHTIAKFLGRARAVKCDQEQIVTFLESQSGLNYIAQVLLDEVDLVVIEDPCFINAKNILFASGAEVVCAPLDAEGISVDYLRERIPAGTRVKLIYVTPSFQDPTGVCMSRSRRSELLRFAKEHEALIVEDSWDGSHVYIKDVPPPLFALSEDENVLYLCSFWKPLYPLSMVSALVIPERLTSYFSRAKMITQEAGPGVEHTLEEFIETGLYEKYIKTVVRTLTPVRQTIIEKLLIAFRDSIQIRKQSSGFWLTVQFNESIDSDEILTRAQEAGLKFHSTRFYYVEPENAPANEFIVHFAE